MIPVRTLVVDDQPLIRAGIATLLSAEPDIAVVGTVADGRAALDAVRQDQPDVVVMDLQMPGLGGIEATTALTSGDGLGVLILTGFDSDADVYAALRAGASGFLRKDAAPAYLAAGVHAVAAGLGWLDPSVTGRLLAEFAARPERAARPPSELAVLTEREREVLVHVAQGLSNADIASRLFIAEGTVKTHLGRVLMKLHLRDRAQAVATAYQSGLVTVVRPTE